jgi:hypothetical protein
MPVAGQAFIPHMGGPGYMIGNAPAYGILYNMTYPFSNLATPAQQPAPQVFAYQPNGAGAAYYRGFQPYPAIDPGMPAAQMTNSSGGVGCEPGYNYFFPAEHTKCHILKTNTPPWQLPPNAQVQFKATHIPCNITMAELLKGFGCDNPAPKKNSCFELVAAGGGRWYKGMEVNGGDKEMMKKTLKDVGWDATRTGNANEKPVVCLWFCKN